MSECLVGGSATAYGMLVMNVGLVCYILGVWVGYRGWREKKMERYYDEIRRT